MNTNTTANPDDSELDQDQELCLQCMTGNRPGVHFCRECGAPLSSYAATAPFESVLAEGHVYRRAVAEPKRLIVVVGIWAIFSMTAWAGILMAATSWRTAGPLGVGAGLALGILSLLIIARTTLNYRHRPAKSDRIC